MSEEIYNTCSCGHREDDHEFIHEYKDVCKVYRRSFKNGKLKVYVIDAKDYKNVTREICSTPMCKMTRINHNELNKIHDENKEIVIHEFVPKLINRREIKFVLNLNDTCSECGDVLKNHKENSKRCNLFEFYLEIRNLSENDTIEIYHPEYDDINIINRFNNIYS